MSHDQKTSSSTSVAPVDAERHERAIALNWLTIAKLAGEHGIRYPTNARMEAFLSAYLSAMSAGTVNVGVHKEIMRLIREEFDPTPPGWEGQDWNDNADDVASKIMSTMSAGTVAQEAVTVKALEWVDKTIPLMHYHAECDDDGEWRYSVFGAKMTSPYTLKRYGVHCGEYQTIEAAKAAAQADYETRIRSTLRASPQASEPAPQVVGDNEAAIALGAAVLTRIEDPAVREAAIRNALRAALTSSQEKR